MINSEEKKDTSIVAYMESKAVFNNIHETLGDKAPQFIASVAALVNTNRDLQDVDKKSILLACLTATALDLPINASLGFSYIIPYKETKTNNKYAQFQMGYKGFIQLALRSGQFETINVSDVRDGEIRGINRLTGEIEFTWKENNREALPVVGYVAHVKLISGFRKTLYMTVKDLQSHGLRYSSTMKRGFGMWKDDFDAMASKTVLKLLLSKYGLMTTQLQKALLADQSIVTDDGYNYVDNTTVDAKAVARDKEKARLIEYIDKASTEKKLLEAKDAVESLNEKDVAIAYQKKFEQLLKVNSEK